MPHALVVDDDQAFVPAIAEFVEQHGFTVTVAETLKECREQLRQTTPDILLIDLLLPDGSGLDAIREIDPAAAPRIVVMTGHANLDSAIESLRAQVFDFLVKPIDISRLKTCLRAITRGPASPAQPDKSSPAMRELVGKSGVIRELRAILTKVAPTNATILLQGASGTGKDLIATMLHQASSRRNKPFLAVNCGAISPHLIGSELFGHERGSFTGAAGQHKGFFERASGGTLFMDEVTEMPMELQVQLLRVLENRVFRRVGGDRELPVDVRLIAATNRDPEQAVKDRKLREDLYFRLNVFPIRVPALRERSGDVVLLAEHFLAELNDRHDRAKHFTSDALRWMEQYDWPGNVRQLGNAVHRGFILAEVEISEAVMAEPGGPSRQNSDHSLNLSVGTPIEDAERRLILATLDHYEGDKPRTAQALGVSLKTLYNRLNRYQNA